VTTIRQITNAIGDFLESLGPTRVRNMKLKAAEVLRAPQHRQLAEELSRMVPSATELTETEPDLAASASEKKRGAKPKLEQILLLNKEAYTDPEIAFLEKLIQSSDYQLNDDDKKLLNQIISDNRKLTTLVEFLKNKKSKDANNFITDLVQLPDFDPNAAWVDQVLLTRSYDTFAKLVRENKAYDHSKDLLDPSRFKQGHTLDSFKRYIKSNITPLVRDPETNSYNKYSKEEREVLYKLLQASYKADKSFRLKDEQKPVLDSILVDPAKVEILKPVLFINQTPCPEEILKQIKGLSNFKPDADWFKDSIVAQATKINDSPTPARKGSLTNLERSLLQHSNIYKRPEKTFLETLINNPDHQLQDDEKEILNQIISNDQKVEIIMEFLQDKSTYNRAESLINNLVQLINFNPNAPWIDKVLLSKRPYDKFGVSLREHGDYDHSKDHLDPARLKKVGSTGLAHYIRSNITPLVRDSETNSYDKYSKEEREVLYKLLEASYDSANQDSSFSLNDSDKKILNVILADTKRSKILQPSLFIDRTRAASLNTIARQVVDLGSFNPNDAWVISSLKEYPESACQLCY